MAFSTLAQLVIVVLVLSVVVVFAVLQFANLGGEAGEFTSTVDSSVNASAGVHGTVMCQVAGGRCVESCTVYATGDPHGGCPDGLYCCLVEE
jgi:hypothetical protein